MSDTEETIQCTNCKINILSNNYTIHSVHCQRNFYLCTKCEQPVNISQRKQHDEESHVVVNCEDCSLEFEKWNIDDHSKRNCLYRKIKCQICDIEVKATEITEHENYCGSRTEKCPECGEFIMLRYKSLHVDSNHTFIKLSDEPGPSPSWQNGRRTLSNFLPDLSKNCKPSTANKRRSVDRKSRNSESKDLRNLDEIFWDNKYENSSNKSENGETDIEVENLFKYKDSKKQLKSDFDDWFSLSNLKISEDKHDNLSSMKPKNGATNEADEESDLMYAIQVSQELNSHTWAKDSACGEDETLKNSYSSLESNAEPKSVQKNMFAPPRRKKKSSDNSLNISRNDSEDVFLVSNEERKSEAAELVKLPCEFCGALIVSNELLSHQSGCSIFMMPESYERRTSTRHKYSFADDFEKKIPCGICNKFFWLSALENHQLHCQRNLAKSWKNQEKTKCVRNIKPINVKSEPGIQNGLESSSPRLSRVGTRSEWLSELSKTSNEESSELRNNLNRPETGVKIKTTKMSRKNRRAPSPPV